MNNLYNKNQNLIYLNTNEGINRTNKDEFVTYLFCIQLMNKDKTAYNLPYTQFCYFLF